MTRGELLLAVLVCLVLAAGMAGVLSVRPAP